MSCNECIFIFFVLPRWSIGQTFLPLACSVIMLGRSAVTGRFLWEPALTASLRFSQIEYITGGIHTVEHQTCFSVSRPLFLLQSGPAEERIGGCKHTQRERERRTVCWGFGRVWPPCGDTQHEESNWNGFLVDLHLSEGCNRCFIHIIIVFDFTHYKPESRNVYCPYVIPLTFRRLKECVVIFKIMFLWIHNKTFSKAGISSLQRTEVSWFSILVNRGCAVMPILPVSVAITKSSVNVSECSLLEEQVRHISSA